jgi:hypothetical protein
MNANRETTNRAEAKTAHVWSRVPRLLHGEKGSPSEPIPISLHRGLRAMIPGVSKPSSQVIVVMLTKLLERFDPEQFQVRKSPSDPVVPFEHEHDDEHEHD